MKNLLYAISSSTYGDNPALGLTEDETALMVPGLINAGKLRLVGAVTPSALTANQNDWNPTGLANANVLRINATAARTITGMAAQPDGTLLLVYNASAFTITLPHDSNSSAAANRIYTPGAANFLLTQKKSAWMRYDGPQARWTIVG
jgi:hypothetical protein